MSRGVDLSDFQKGSIHALHFLASWSYTKIANSLGIKRSSIAKYCQRADLHHADAKCNVVLRKGRCGRKSCTTPSTDRRICRLSKQDPFRSAVDIHREVSEGNTMCVRTVRRRLHIKGIKCFTPAQKTLLTANHAKKRLMWARQKRLWHAEWNNIAYSDESQFVINAHHHQYVHRVTCQRYKPINVEKRENRSMGNVMVWGCFSKHFYTDLIRIEGRNTAVGYINMLRHNLLPNMHALLPTGGQFQHDNAPIHTARATTAWLLRNNIPVLPWPSLSPDLNPIENIWSLLSRRLQQQTQRPTNSQTLFEALQRCWREIMSNQPLRNALVSSMKRRITAVINNHGYYTKY